MVRQKASHVLCSGKVVEITFEMPGSEWKLGAKDEAVFRPFFDEALVVAQKNISDSTADDLRIFTFQLPFSQILQPGETVIVAALGLEPKDVEKGGRFHGLPVNELAQDLLVDPMNGESAKVHGPAILFYHKGGKDFTPKPDFATAYDMIVDELPITIDNNKSGGFMGKSQNATKQRFTILADMYRGELRKGEREGRSDVWEYLKDKDKAFMRPQLAPDGSQPAFLKQMEDMAATFGLPAMTQGWSRADKEWAEYQERNRELENIEGAKLCGSCLAHVADAKKCGGCRCVLNKALGGVC